MRSARSRRCSSGTRLRHTSWCDGRFGATARNTGIQTYEHAGIGILSSCPYASMLVCQVARDGLNLALLLLRPQEQHRDVAVAKDCVGDAAEYKAAETASAMG